jgi:solute carrier family 50 protein (sugar transporter)
MLARALVWTYFTSASARLHRLQSEVSSSELLVDADGSPSSVEPEKQSAESQPPVEASKEFRFGQVPPSKTAVTGAVVTGAVVTGAAVAETPSFWSLQHALEVYAPATGVVTSNLLYFSALPAALRANRIGSLGELNPLPAAIMVPATFGWICYALAIQNAWILASNLPGAAAALVAIVVMLPLMEKGDSRLLHVQVTMVVGPLVWVSLFSILVFSGVAPVRQAEAIGYVASCFCVVLFASPLSTISEVVRARDAGSIYLPLTLAQCLNTALWTAYGVFAVDDVFVYGPNGIGLALGVSQVALKVLFPSVSEKD